MGPISVSSTRLRFPMLVTGASGLLGANFVFSARELFQLTACYGRNPVRWAGVNTVRIDLKKEPQLAALLESIKPAIIVHFAALTNVDYCEKHPAEAEACNVLISGRLARWASDHGALMVLMSTDSVFNGAKGAYRESDSPSPINVYATSKLAAEQSVRECGSEHIIIRANIYGWNAQPKVSLAEWILSQLEGKLVTPGFTDVIFSPLLVNTLANIILGLIAKEARGTIHVGSTGALSKFDFARKVANIFGHSEDLIVPIQLALKPLQAPRPLNTSLISSRLSSEFHLDAPEVQADLSHFKRLREEGFLTDLKSTVLEP